MRIQPSLLLALAALPTTAAFHPSTLPRPQLSTALQSQTEINGELNLPAFRNHGDRKAPGPSFVTLSIGGFREQRKGSLTAPIIHNAVAFQEAALGPGSALEEALAEEEVEIVEEAVELEVVEEEEAPAIKVDLDVPKEESKVVKEQEETEEINAAAEPVTVEPVAKEEKEETSVEPAEPEPVVVYRTGITEEEVTEDDAEAVQLAYDRVKRLCPNMHPDLLGFLFWIQKGELEEASVAMNQLSEVLDDETLGEETTLALYRACGHVDIVRTVMRHAKKEELQQVGMQVLWKLSSRHRAKQLEFEEIGGFQKSLVSVGAADCAFAAIERFPNNSFLATYSLCVVNNLIDTYTFDELFEIGLIEETMAALEKFSDNSSVLFVACDILYRASKAKPNASLSKLEHIHAVSILGQIMEHFDGKDERIHAKAEQALLSILMIGKDNSAPQDTPETPSTT